ncbi:MAG: hypothetical protein ACR2P6_01995, partial [Gammaproteobacteria bacterium]
MKNALPLLILLAAATGCSESGDNDIPQVGTDACSVDGQKQFVLDAMNDLYYWNDVLPADVDLASFATAEDLLAYLIEFQPLDGFSYIDSASADAQFFGAGQYEGYGFSSRYEAFGDLRLTRVFASSPAAAAGLERGQQVLMLDGRTIAEIDANEGTGEVFSQSSVAFTMRRPDGSEFTGIIERGLVTIDPVPQYRIIPRPDGTSVGYLELATFISTADAELD